MVGSKNFILKIVIQRRGRSKYRLFLANPVMKVAGTRSYRVILPAVAVACCGWRGAIAQTVPSAVRDTLPVPQSEVIDYRKQRDLIDLAMIIIHEDPDRRLKNMNVNSRRLHLSASPILEYTVATGLTTGLAAGGAFLTGNAGATNVSSFVGAVKYTQRKQFLLPVQSSVWANNNSWNFLGDWRYLYYPQDSYGIGGHTTPDDRFTVTYKYVRFYEYALRNIGHHWYAGAGYQLDWHWDITGTGVSPAVQQGLQLYGLGTRSTSSGLALDLQYDNRPNSINPAGGSTYANLVFLQNVTLLGSDNPWNSVLIDIRKYYAVGRKAILAFWFFSVLGLSGHAPYLDLPGTGTDMYNNTGRGYEEDRYIGNRYIDLEAEYRFAITRNGLLGGVVFCNAGSVSDAGTNRFEVIFPGFGAGLRIKFNKFSNTNACLDYGWGTMRSRGFFGNLGEVF